ncbi:MAG: M48 family metallopeptidase [Lentimicrobiaceae bacterium]|nr:M48 family metallopeptidase [Lentimicrobiaceae bacterium]MCB9023289.1 M48 family metallopeptidase [Lentimicrobiaceae bacterium]MCO5266976.1 M48 family metallopeptidase [Lentimicrobium sp.]
MKNQIFAIVLGLALALTSCSKVPITGRRQFNVVPGQMISEMSLTSYQDFLSQNPPIPESNKNTQQVKRVGQKIAQAVEEYLINNGQQDKVSAYKWEFNLVESPEVNAWCLPGGKVVVYTGILPLTKDDAGLAVVMGHEIAHAVANHGGERMSQQLAVVLGGVSLDIALQQKPAQTRELFNMAYGIGSTLGTLAYSRTHEYEADKLGMVFMAMAGYEPERAVSFWEEMAAIPGQAPPELLSTHPSSQNRIKELRNYIPNARIYLKKQ